MENKIKNIIVRKEFKSFWECFDYLKLASFDEIDALMASLEQFKGDIWSDVISIAKVDILENRDEMVIFASGSTFTNNTGEVTMTYLKNSDTPYTDMLNNFICGVDPANIKDDLLIDVYVMTDNANRDYLPLYRAYIETRRYEPIEALENHFKILRINLITEVAIKIFNDGYKKYKYD